MNNLRVLFMGTPDFALQSCKAVYEQCSLVGVVTQPDRPKGRGGKLSAPPIKEFALERQLPCWQPETLKDGSFQAVLDETKPDLIVVAAYGRILPEYILNYPRYGCINVHGSLLPLYRGAAPIQRAVINGDEKTGVTIMKMAKGMDTGDIIHVLDTPITENDTSGSLFERLADLGAKALMEAIRFILDGTASFTPQDDAKATYAPMIDKIEAQVDFSKDAKCVKNLIMGMNPSPGAFIECDGYRLKFHEASLGPKTTAQPGTVVEVSASGISVACGDGYSVLIKSIQKQGKNKTDAYSYACGAKLSVGEEIR